MRHDKGSIRLFPSGRSCAQLSNPPGKTIPRPFLSEFCAQNASERFLSDYDRRESRRGPCAGKIWTLKFRRRGCVEHFEPGYCDENRVFEESEADRGRADDKSRHAYRAVVVLAAVVMMVERHCKEGQQENKQAN